MSATPSLVECPICQEPAPAGSNWCEACGSDLATVLPAASQSAPCVACGERDISDDGYCMACGRKQPAERDHLEIERGTAAAVTDRGRRHHHNEDAAALGVLPGGGAVLVVCDGVSSTPGSAEASQAAASAACDLLVDRLGGHQAGVDGATVLEALVAAAGVAQAEAAAVPEQISSAPNAQAGPPSSTFVAAVGRHLDGQTHLWVAWLGDSRAYWVDGSGATPLTEDHEVGGSLTRWLGADSVDALPDLTSFSTHHPGRLLVCSDGLWRYADPPGKLAGLVRRLLDEHGSTRALAGALVDHAVTSGGHDNVTVAVWPSPPAVPAGDQPTRPPANREGEPADE